MWGCSPLVGTGSVLGELRHRGALLLPHSAPYLIRVPWGSCGSAAPSIREFLGAGRAAQLRACSLPVPPAGSGCAPGAVPCGRNGALRSGPGSPLIPSPGTWGLSSPHRYLRFTPTERALHPISPPPPIYPHGCSAVFPTNTRLSARSRGELPSRYLTAPPHRGGGGAHSAEGTDERPPLSHPPTSPHKQTTRRAGRENGRESYFFSYWLNCPSILSAPPLAARSALPIGLPSRHSGGSAGHAFRPPHPAFSLCVPCAKEKQPLNGPRGGASAAANKRRGDWRQRGVQISTGRSDWLGVAAAGRAPSSRSGGYCLAAPEAVRAADSGTGARAAAAPW